MFFGIKSRVIWFMAFVKLEKQLATGKQLWGNTLFRLRVQHFMCPIDLTYFPHLCTRAGRSRVSEGYFSPWCTASAPEELCLWHLSCLRSNQDNAGEYTIEDARNEHW